MGGLQAEEVMGGLQAEDRKPLAYVLEGSLTAVLRSRMEAKRSLGEAISREIWKAETGVVAVKVVK